MTHDEDRRLLTRVVIRNYKSIGGCDVRPARLSFLVGPNGAGKSNFLDALRFVADALSYTLDHALRDRGGIQEVRRRSQGRPNHFGVRLEFQLPGAHGHYAFEIGARASAGYSVQKEECVFVEHGAGRAKHTYHVQDGVVTFSSIDAPPVAASDRLYLVNASGLSAFRPVYEALSGMGFYNLNPEVIRELQPPDPGTKLKRDGVNLASVLANLEAHATTRKTCVEEYLAKVVPGVVRVSSKSIGPRETIEFRQEVRGSEHPWRFLAPNMSDGTLRALGVLVALFQGNGTTGARLIGIEEPELALHPAATGILIDALRDASERTQVLVTSHSPDLLDHEDIDSESVLAVNSTHGETHIGPLDSAGVSALRDRLYTAGELLRMDQLEPAPSQSPKQPDLFGSRD
ncbi:MAG: AAA family ATPase [Planctomycetes bacterium]|nr:AAA family ATPase [Planctomycetota bacterium]